MAPKKGQTNNPDGRPKKALSKKRDQVVRLTQEEKDAIEKKRDLAGFKSTGQFVSKEILGWHSDEDDD